jgi:hypothetical protein
MVKGAGVCCSWPYNAVRIFWVFICTYTFWCYLSML